MSQQIVNAVNAAHPALLLTNIDATCFQFASYVIDALKAQGHMAYLMCKTAGEGQYTPPGFVPFDAVGLDGKTYHITGFSHDAIWSDGEQVDTVGRGNDSPQPIYDTNGNRITGIPTWNLIPREYWRPNNPPYLGVVVPPGPVPPVVVKPPYLGDAYYNQVSAILDADYREAGQSLNAGSGCWFGRVDYEIYVEGLTPDAAIAKHRPEWRSALGLH